MKYHIEVHRDEYKEHLYTLSSFSAKKYRMKSWFKTFAEEHESSSDHHCQFHIAHGVGFDIIYVDSGISI
jgi:hypothetical protein